MGCNAGFQRATHYREGVPFDDLTDAELDFAAHVARESVYDAARLFAAQRLIDLSVGVSGVVDEPGAAVAVLMGRDSTDPRFELLSAFEQRWSLLVLRITKEVLRPTEAVADARRRGATWAQIGAVLGVTASSACNRFGG